MGKLLEIQKLYKAYDRGPVLQDLNLSVEAGRIVGIVGPNGCGKTTLFKLIMGQYSPRKGALLKGPKVEVGYYDQTQANLTMGKTLIDELWDEFPELNQTQLRCALAAFLFRGDEVFQPVEQLSGGERARLLLLKLMLRRDNLLLLDEPTNHLDIESREALEQALSGYDGTIFIVSHDRYFINRMADKVLLLTPQGCQEFLGNYDYYLEKTQEEAVKQSAEQMGGETVLPRQNDYRRRKEQQSALRRLNTRLKRVEETVTATEQDIEELKRQIGTEEVAADYEQLLHLSGELEQKEMELEHAMDEWEQVQTALLEMGEEPG